MISGIPKIEMPKNEPILNYGPGSKEKSELKAEMIRLSNKKIDIPCVIGGRSVRTGKMADCVMPHDHDHVLGSYHKAGKKEVNLAIQAAMTGCDDQIKANADVCYDMEPRLGDAPYDPLEMIYEDAFQAPSGI